MEKSQYNHQSHMRVVVPCIGTYEFLNLNDIVRCEGLQNYSRVYLKDGTILTSTCSIGTLRIQLEARGFFSCHKSHLINESLIVRYAKEGFVQMEDESLVPVSRRRKNEFIKVVIEKHCIS